MEVLWVDVFLVGICFLFSHSFITQAKKTKSQMWQLLREKDAYYEYLMFISCLSSEKFKVLCWCYLLHPHMSASFEERTGKCLKSGSMLDIRWDQVLAFCTTPRSGLYSVFSAPVLEHKLDASNPSLILENPSLHSLRCLSVALRQKDWTCKQLLLDPLTNPVACWLVSCIRLFAKSLAWCTHTVPNNIIPWSQFHWS